MSVPTPVISPLPLSSPESQGVDPAGISAFLDAMDAAAIELHSLMIIRHGALVAQGWWDPYGPERVHLVYSLSKSFTSTAAGLAVAERLLDLDATVLSYFPELDEHIDDPRSRSMLVRHIAAMASGHLADTVEALRTGDPVNPVRSFLEVPPDREPGSVFTYNQGCTYSLAAIIQRQSGQTLIEYLRPRLFEPLGIGPAGWIQHPPGRDIGFSGLHVTTDAIARLGLLYLNDGVVDGRRLLPAAWVAEATRLQVRNPDEPNPDWRQGYGFQFWLARHGYRGDGAYGQFCIVLPEQDTVVAMTAGTDRMQQVLDGVWEHVLPALDAPVQAGPSAAGLALSDRLDRLRLVPLEGSSAPAVGADDASTRAFTPDATASRQQTSLTSIEVVRDGEDWRLTLVEGEQRFSSIVGNGRWVCDDGPGVPIAVSGGWTDPDTFRADVLFIETPHRLHLTASVGSGTFAAAWAITPLHQSRLADLQMPRRLG